MLRMMLDMWIQQSAAPPYSSLPFTEFLPWRGCFMIIASFYQYLTRTGSGRMQTCNQGISFQFVLKHSSSDQAEGLTASAQGKFREERPKRRPRRWDEINPPAIL
jgi:hypothetical protein